MDTETQATVKEVYERFAIRANAFEQKRSMVDGFSYDGRSSSKSLTPLRREKKKELEELLECRNEVVEMMKLMYQLGYRPLPPPDTNIDNYAAKALGLPPCREAALEPVDPVVAAVARLREESAAARLVEAAAAHRREDKAAAARWREDKAVVVSLQPRPGILRFHQEENLLQPRQVTHSFHQDEYRRQEMRRVHQEDHRQETLLLEEHSGEALRRQKLRDMEEEREEMGQRMIMRPVLFRLCKKSDDHDAHVKSMERLRAKIQSLTVKLHKMEEEDDHDTHVKSMEKLRAKIQSLTVKLHKMEEEEEKVILQDLMEDMEKEREALDRESNEAREAGKRWEELSEYLEGVYFE